MGCRGSKPFEDERAIIAGSTIISGRSVMILDSRILMPLLDTETQESSVVEIDLKQRNIKILKGVAGTLTSKFVKNSRANERIRERAFIDVETKEIDEGEHRESSFVL